MGGIWILVLLALVLVAPFLAVQLYLLAWIAGPAVRHLGKRWEEGRRAAAASAADEGAGWYSRGLQDAWSGKVRPAAVAPAGENTAAPAPRSVDAGHRMFGLK